jgi:DNA-binding beta-propeller fold protein YncE
MDSRAQDVILCDLCKTDPVQNRCEHCQINLCNNCVVNHLSDSSKNHNVVLYKSQRKFAPRYSKCPKHIDKDCDLYCEQCDSPVCTTCGLFGEHKGHNISDILEKLKSKQQLLQKDLEELETKIYSRYEEMATDLQMEKVELETKYEKMTSAAEQQGEVWQREITTIVNHRKSKIEEMKIEHLAVLEKHTDEITLRMNEIKQVILQIKNILGTNDISLTSSYKSRNDEFNKLPQKVRVTIPKLRTPKINTEKVNEMFGSLSSLSITRAKSLLAVPRLAATIGTGYDRLYSVRCLREQQMWIQGEDKIMKLLNLQGKLLKSIQTKSGEWPQAIAVTQEGNLVYTDCYERTVNIVKNEKIRTMITLQGWRPRDVCSTSFDDLLISMRSDDKKHFKIVRYSGSAEKQTIQFDDQGRPLFSCESVNYISENRNLDICVSDVKSEAVIVVNRSGKLRFRYTGHPSASKQSFYPSGIATDSQSHILIAEYKNYRIHILDQDGQFFRYIDNCHLDRPYGICVDIEDNLFVAEHFTANVKKIQYL